jgi:predicted alpha/beta-hydrolase family hydrolase
MGTGFERSALLSASAPQLVSIPVDGGHHVSGLLLRPADSRACLVLAHGAGAGMEHPFMNEVASALAARGIATLRYQFPYMERRSRRPDPPPLCHATVRAAVAEARRLEPRLPLVAGGRSFGGRMTSQTQAEAPLPDVRGLAFLAFPLHPAGQPSDARAKHLHDVRIPMLFVQGTRDALADAGLLVPLVKRLGDLARLEQIAEGDHSFHVPARTGRTDGEAMDAVLTALDAFITALASQAPP